ncbi:hypothetical protein Sango_1453500 [Sesamum angolense]|uniref:PAR1 protein n=1 Tax=Sesamum angolense TaxID=2727404 RepID=A0AAE2BSI4_9LAMI|nr:hypothetical protein Sango_1453500 [Sesamum angolense]
MAFSMKIIMFSLTCSLFVQGTLAEVLCEKLPSNLCAFAIASSGKRCILETYRNELGDVDFICKTTEVVVERMAGHIESDQCINACGVEREFIGISTDSFLSSEFTAHLCSSACYHNCPNVVDLFFNLAAGEAMVASPPVQSAPTCRTCPLLSPCRAAQNPTATAHAAPAPVAAASAPNVRVICAIKDYTNAIL